MASPINAAVSAIQAKFKVAQKTEFRGETTLLVERAEIRELCAFCKETLSFDMLLDLSGVDNFGEEPRFEVVYELYQMATDAHLRLKITVSEDELSVPSVIGVWPTADWHEREAWDMYGIGFSGHPDLRRILMWEGYPFFPLRKDFPLAGRASEMPDVAFSKAAPLAGGPFVTVPSTATTKDREPRSREQS
ncbi:MAG: NADH-quinone oxidoreductase subunit C [Chthoniobacter sp.]|nr:NADH-quinone oxidoreductase subunit C [Chthoniobacter sp.]